MGRPFMWNGIDVGGRAAVVRLSDGTLWVHSPLKLDEGLKQALAKIGEVRHIVSPNFEAHQLRLPGALRTLRFCST